MGDHIAIMGRAQNGTFLRTSVSTDSASATASSSGSICFSRARKASQAGGGSKAEGRSGFIWNRKPGGRIRYTPKWGADAHVERSWATGGVSVLDVIRQWSATVTSMTLGGLNATTLVPPDKRTLS